MTSKALFQDDAYLRECQASVVMVGDGAIVLDQTIFYARGGGQPGDSGTLDWVTPEGGTVTVRTRDMGNGTLRVTVDDTGPGIPDDNLKDVFKRFYSERPGQEFGNNSGLGLAISKQIMDAHGGEIWAENIRAPGKGQDTPPDGARFVVELPL